MFTYTPLVGTHYEGSINMDAVSEKLRGNEEGVLFSNKCILVWTTITQ
jgi:hypothetical protein